MKKIALLLCVLIISACIFLACPAYAYTPTFEVNAKNAMLVNTDTGDVLYARSIDEKVYPASVSYLMNALVVCDQVKPEDVVTVKREVVNQLLGTGAIVASLKDGEEITVSDLLHCMLMSSHNDAALVLADYVSGSSDGFVNLMNSKAKSLGMKRSNFATPTGLYNSQQYSTVSDMYRLYSAAMKNELIASILAKSRYTVEPTNKSSKRILTNTTWLIDRTTNYYYKYAVAGKTGNSDASGRCVVSNAQYDGRNYICVLAGCNASAPTRVDFTDTINLYKWAFVNFEYKTVVTKGEQVPVSANVDLSWDIDNITLVAGKTVVALLPSDADLSTIEYVPELDKKVFDAPIKQGEKLGTAKIYFTNPSAKDSEPLGEVDLLAGQKVEYSFVLWLWRVIKKIFCNPLVIAAVIIVIIAFIVMTVMANVKAKRERNKKLKLKKRL